ncbi:MAG: HD-GYP domain-containing protein [Halanaerobiales bacterium]
MGIRQLQEKELGSLPATRLRISELFLTLSRALDMSNTRVLKHSRRVAYISLELARRLRLSTKRLNQVVLAALIHDIGIVNDKYKQEAHNHFVVDRQLARKHSQQGYELTRNIHFLPGIDEIIRYHYHRWGGNNFDSCRKEDIPLASRIIHLADRVESLVDDDTYILLQVKDITSRIKSCSGDWFDPQLVERFLQLSGEEYFWLTLASSEFDDVLKNWGKNTQTRLQLGDLEQIASIIASLIDRVRPFTSRHSTGVATIAAMIAHDLGYSQREQRGLRIAGLFHDLGKLIVPSRIIEKPGELTEKEYKIVKQHSFYTYRLLKKIKGLGSIPEWAGYHHEKLDGSGYPFHLKGEQLNTGSRIMAVSDIFQALTEERPYRPSYSMDEALEMLRKIEKKGRLAPAIITALADNI